MTANGDDHGTTRTFIAVHDDALRTLATDYFADAGHLVTSGPSSAAALDAAASGNHDLVVADMFMPGLHGPALARRLAATGRQSGTAVVFLSGLPGLVRSVPGVAVVPNLDLAQAVRVSVQLLHDTRASA